MASLLKKKVQRTTSKLRESGIYQSTKDSLVTVKTKAEESIQNVKTKLAEEEMTVNYGRYMAKPVSLEGKIWKRRSGMGKYKHHASKLERAWELRHFELRGTTLLYYSLTEQDQDEIVFDGGSGEDCSSERQRRPSTPNYAKASLKTWAWKGEEALKEEEARKTDDLVEESLEDPWNDSQANYPTGTPRGYLDFAEDKALVHASMGHLNGAPSPFCLSIVTGMSHEYTKWKLCFDDMSTQMQWLAALTNVVVQCSVDAYNVQLVQIANPNHKNNEKVFLRPPPLFEPPPNINHQSDGGDDHRPSISQAHQLWLTEDYSVKSKDGSVIPECVAEQPLPSFPADSSYTAALQQVERQHQQELMTREMAYQKEVDDLQDTVDELRSAAATKEAKHQQEVDKLKKTLACLPDYWNKE